MFFLQKAVKLSHHIHQEKIKDDNIALLGKKINTWLMFASA
jgi:hypothetical protein